MSLNTKFVTNDNIITVKESTNLEISTTLSVGTYSVGFNDRMGFFLKKIQDFNPVEKLYGDIVDKRDRIINTFLSRDSNLGVLLSGTKGTGKTLLTKCISIELAKLGMSTIIVNHGYDSSGLSEFLRSVDTPSMVIFDEFDKIFRTNNDDDNEQNGQSGLLNILDGVFNSRKLFVFSCNNENYVNPYFKSRPGRIFYHFKFTALTKNIITEYCELNLKDKNLVSDVVKSSFFIPNFTFDILKAIVEECNRYNEPPKNFLSILNVEYGVSGTFECSLIDLTTNKTYGLSPYVTVNICGKNSSNIHAELDDNELLILGKSIGCNTINETYNLFYNSNKFAIRSCSHGEGEKRYEIKFYATEDDMRETYDDGSFMIFAEKIREHEIGFMCKMSSPYSNVSDPYGSSVQHSSVVGINFKKIATAPPTCPKRGICVEADA